MEHVHLYSFPAVGSLKEKRMCFDEAKANKSIESAKTELKDLKDFEKNVSKGDKIAEHISDAFQQTEKMYSNAKTDDERETAAKKVKEIKNNIRPVMADWEKPMLKIITVHAEAEAENVKKMTAVPTPDPEDQFKTRLMQLAKWPEPSSALLSEYGKAIQTVRKAKKKNTNQVGDFRRPIFDAVFAYQSFSIKSDLPLLQEKIEAYNNAKKSKGDLGAPDLNKATDEVRESVKSAKEAALETMRAPGTADNAARAAEQYAEVLKLEKELGAAPAPAPSAGPSTKPDDIKEKYKSEIAAIKAADGKSANIMVKALDAVNKPSISEDDRKAIGTELQKESFKTYVVSYNLDKKQIIAEPKTSPAGQEINEGLTIKNLVEYIVKFLRNMGLLPADMAGEKLTTSKIDDKIAKLKAEIEVDKRDLAKKDIVAAKERQVRSLEQARPIVIEAGKIGVDAEVETDGRISFSGPKDKLEKMQVFLNKNGIKSHISDGKLYLDTITADANGNLPPAEVKRLTDALKAIAQLLVSYRPGQGYGYMPGYGYGPGGYWNGAQAGFDPRTGLPYAQAQQHGGFSQGFSGKGASSQRA